MVKTLFWTAVLIGIAAFYFLGYSPARPGGAMVLRAKRVLLIRILEVTTIAFYLLARFAWNWDFALTTYPVPVSYAGLAVTVAGVGLTSWAKYELRSNFSLSLGVRSDHQFITSGPYSLVRHPMYTGLLLQTIGGAMVYNSGITLLLLTGPFLVFFYWQSLAEEKPLVERFEDAYRRYGLGTGRLFPRLRR